MTKRTEARLTAHEKSLYNEGQAFIKRGKELMEMARYQAAERERIAKKLAEDRARRRTETFTASINSLLDDIKKSQGLGTYKYKIISAETARGVNGDTAVVTLRLRAD